jgi:Mg2+-importing ATPase
VLVERDGKRMLVVKGAPEDVLKLASRYQGESDGAARPLDDAARETARSVFEKLGVEGFRALGVAWREVEPERDHAYLDDESDLIFAGFAAFLDPAKESARPALEALARLNVAVRIVTGDNEHVTAHVCRELGLNVTGVLTGPELAELTDEALAARLDDINLFCRVSPPQKARIIRALRRRGHVVGYLGDGINDAPSLHAADVGLSVEGAADVAKEAATMILLRKDLGVLAEGVREGRRTFANIMKYIMMGTSSNFGNMFSMAGGVLFLPFLPMLPVQILLNNLLYDMSETAIPLDDVDEDMIERPRHWDMRFVRDFTFVMGPVSSLFDFMTFGLLLWVFHSGEALFHTGWFVESLMTQVLVIFVIRTRGSPFASRPHPILAATSLAAVAVAVALPYTPLGVWFGFSPPPLELLAALAGMTAVYLVFVQVVKHWFYSRHPLKVFPLGATHVQ